MSGMRYVTADDSRKDASPSWQAYSGIRFLQRLSDFASFCPRLLRISSLGNIDRTVVHKTDHRAAACSASNVVTKPALKTDSDSGGRKVRSRTVMISIRVTLLVAIQADTYTVDVSESPLTCFRTVSTYGDHPFPSWT